MSSTELQKEVGYKEDSGSMSNLLRRQSKTKLTLPSQSIRIEAPYRKVSKHSLSMQAPVIKVIGAEL